MGVLKNLFKKVPPIYLEDLEPGQFILLTDNEDNKHLCVIGTFSGEERVLVDFKGQIFPLSDVVSSSKIKKEITILADGIEVNWNSDKEYPYIMKTNYKGPQVDNEYTEKEKEREIKSADDIIAELREE